MTESEEKQELRSILIGLLLELGEKEINIYIHMAIIVAYRIEQEMVNWIATFKDNADALTLEAFKKHLNELVNEADLGISS